MSKSIDRDVHVRVDTIDRDVHVRVDTNLPVSIINNGNSKFSEAFNEAGYQEKFMAGLKSEFATSKVIPDNVNPEFEINFSEFIITESTKMETVNDTTSEDHGKQYELTTLKYSAKGTVVRIKDGVSYNWSANKDKSEKVTSLRSGGQVVTGQNKEKNEYREKNFNSEEAGSLAQKCGRRSGASIVKEIIRSLK
jgi:hypothetical protein